MSEKQLIRLMWVIVFIPIVLGFFNHGKPMMSIAIASLVGVFIVGILIFRIRKNENRPLTKKSSVVGAVVLIVAGLAIAGAMDYFYFQPKVDKLNQRYLERSK